MKREEEVLKVVLREMCAYGEAWRLDWSDFDGRQLLRQLDSLAEWAERALSDPTVGEYSDGTLFLDAQKEDSDD